MERSGELARGGGRPPAGALPLPARQEHGAALLHGSRGTPPASERQRIHAGEGNRGLAAANTPNADFLFYPPLPGLDTMAIGLFERRQITSRRESK